MNKKVLFAGIGAIVLFMVLEILLLTAPVLRVGNYTSKKDGTVSKINFTRHTYQIYSEDAQGSGADAAGFYSVKNNEIRLGGRGYDAVRKSVFAIELGDRRYVSTVAIVIQIILIIFLMGACCVFLWLYEEMPQIHKKRKGHRRKQ